MSSVRVNLSNADPWNFHYRNSNLHFVPRYDYREKQPIPVCRVADISRMTSVKNPSIYSFLRVIPEEVRNEMLSLGLFRESTCEEILLNRLQLSRDFNEPIGG